MNAASVIIEQSLDAIATAMLEEVTEMIRARLAAGKAVQEPANNTPAQFPIS